MEYTVVTSMKKEDLTDFLQEVNQLLNQGWELAGGICSVTEGGAYKSYYIQALIKK